MGEDPNKPQDHTGDVAASPDRGPNRLGTMAGIAGVVGILLFFSVTRGLGLFVAVSALLLGFVARSQARSHGLRIGMANVGIISGFLVSGLYPLTLYLETIWPV